MGSNIGTEWREWEKCLKGTSMDQGRSQSFVNFYVYDWCVVFMEMMLKRTKYEPCMRCAC